VLLPEAPRVFSERPVVTPNSREKLSNGWRPLAVRLQTAERMRHFYGLKMISDVPCLTLCLF
jgi:hypothetical protein